MKIFDHAVSQASDYSLLDREAESEEAATMARRVLYAVSATGMLVLLLTIYLIAEIFSRTLA